MSPGIFDQRHPPDPDLVADCVHCGFCLPACPTYQLWGEEADSPRGRIWLMKLGLEGEVELDEAFVGHIDACLGCMACVTACPSGVRYDRLIEDTRAQIERRDVRTRADRAFRAALFSVFPHPRRLRAAAALARAYQRTGLRWGAHRTGLTERLPPRLRALEGLLPDPVRRPVALPEVVPARDGVRRRVGLMVGCVQRVFFGDTNVATARVLAAEGCEVAIPRSQGCCGALELHAGRDEPARQRARRLIAAMDAVAVETVVVSAAGCGSAMKEYGALLADDPAWADRATAFSARVRDVTEVLAELEPRAPRHQLRARVAYQDACHLAHAQGVREAPRRALATIPGLELVELAEPETCCGSAGVYNLLHPDAGADLGRRKAGHVIAAAPDALASANPGCLLQLRRHLVDAGVVLPTFHPVQLLDASIRASDPLATIDRTPERVARGRS